MACPVCKSAVPFLKVIYMGFPMRLCATEDCGCLQGMWSLVLHIGLVPFNGYFMTYDRGYLNALWCWLTSGWDDEE
jgi:hypothetical protein